MAFLNSKEKYQYIKAIMEDSIIRLMEYDFDPL
jgi:hypothetical protein